MNELQIKGNWNVIKGKLKQVTANLPTMILPTAKATKTNWSGAQQKLGKTREEIQRAIQEAGM